MGHDNLYQDHLDFEEKRRAKQRLEGFKARIDDEILSEHLTLMAKFVQERENLTGTKRAATPVR